MLDTLYGPQRSQVKKPSQRGIGRQSRFQAAVVGRADEILLLTERGNSLGQARLGSGNGQKLQRASGRTDVRVRSPRSAARPNARGHRRQIAAARSPPTLSMAWGLRRV